MGNNTEVIIRLKNGQRVGKVRGDTFSRFVKEEHVWRSHGSSGIAYDEFVVNQLLNNGIKYLACTCSSAPEVTLTASMGTFQSKAVPLEVVGRDEQRVLKMQDWKSNASPDVRRQLGLFEE